MKSVLSSYENQRHHKKSKLKTNLTCEHWSKSLLKNTTLNTATYKKDYTPWPNEIHFSNAKFSQNVKF